MNNNIEYFAVFSGYSPSVIEGTLAEILKEIINESNDPEDYRFFPASSEVKIKYERKLVLSES